MCDTLCVLLPRSTFIPHPNKSSSKKNQNKKKKYNIVQLQFIKLFTVSFPVFYFLSIFNINIKNIHIHQILKLFYSNNSMQTSIQFHLIKILYYCVAQSWTGWIIILYSTTYVCKLHLCIYIFQCFHLHFCCIKKLKMSHNDHIVNQKHPVIIKFRNITRF